MSKDWLKVYSSSKAHKVKIVKGILKDSEIESFEVNKKHSVLTYLSHGEIELYVDQNSFIKANHLISKNQL